MDKELQRLLVLAILYNKIPNAKLLQLLTLLEDGLSIREIIEAMLN